MTRVSEKFPSVVLLENIAESGKLHGLQLFSYLPWRLSRVAGGRRDKTSTPNVALPLCQLFKKENRVTEGKRKMICLE